ncbi:mucin-1 [Prinia subflava]|uniref:mucin-1 n=1 Tax=Prinia subflava TaxID=208062 RepID=UPI002FE08F6F
MSLQHKGSPLCSPSRHYLRTLCCDCGATLASHEAGQESGVGGPTRASPGTGTLTGISTLLRDWGSPQGSGLSAGQGQSRTTVAFDAHPCQEHASPVPKHGWHPLALGWSTGTQCGTWHHLCPEWGWGFVPAGGPWDLEAGYWEVLGCRGALGCTCVSISGGGTGVYLSVGRGDDQPVMINPGLSRRMRPPLHEGLGYSVAPVCPPHAPHQVLGPVAQPREARQMLLPPLPQDARLLSRPVPPPEAGSAHGTGTLPAVIPQAREVRGSPPGGLMLQGPHWRGGTSVPSGAERPPCLEPAAGWGLSTCSRCSIKLWPLSSCQFRIPGLRRVPPANGRAAAAQPRVAPGPPDKPMAFTVLLLLLVLGTGTHAMTTETTMEMETTETTTVEMTTETTSTPTLWSNKFPKSTGGSRPQPGFPYATVFPGTNTTNFQFGNHSMGNATSNSTVVPAHSSPAIPHVNASSNGSSWAPHTGTNSSSAAPTVDGNGTTSAQVNPTQITSEGSTAPRQTPTQGGPKPSKPTAQLPAAVQLLVRVPLSFRIINRSFNESLRDPASEEYRSLSSAVLGMFEHVFGCAGCMGTQTYAGCSELRYSQGSVEVQSTLVFGNGSDDVTPDAAEQRLRKSLDHNGFVMGLQLDSIQSSTAVMSPAPAPVVPDWAIALLVLVSILLLFSIFTCLLLMSTCTCRRKSRGKLDLLSQKDSYHPMAEYLQYQSHGRYVSPNSKPNPYSQVAGSTTRAGTFTYTNPAAGSDNL